MEYKGLLKGLIMHEEHPSEVARMSGYYDGDLDYLVDNYNGNEINRPEQHSDYPDSNALLTLIIGSC